MSRRVGLDDLLRSLSHDVTLGFCGYREEGSCSHNLHQSWSDDLAQAIAGYTVLCAQSIMLFLSALKMIFFVLISF